jgi:hypothetical protein
MGREETVHVEFDAQAGGVGDGDLAVDDPGRVDGESLQASCQIQ